MGRDWGDAVSLTSMIIWYGRMHKRTLWYVLWDAQRRHKKSLQHIHTCTPSPSVCLILSPQWISPYLFILGSFLASHDELSRTVTLNYLSLRYIAHKYKLPSPTRLGATTPSGVRTCQWQLPLYDTSLPYVDRDHLRTLTWFYVCIVDSNFGT